jgi:hypothetical protein
MLDRPDGTFARQLYQVHGILCLGRVLAFVGVIISCPALGIKRIIKSRLAWGENKDSKDPRETDTYDSEQDVTGHRNARSTESTHVNIFRITRLATLQNNYHIYFIISWVLPSALHLHLLSLTCALKNAR